MDAPVHSEEARAIEWCDIRYVEIRVCRDVLNVHGHFLRDLREILLHPPRVVPAALDDGIEKKKQCKKSSRPPWGYGLPPPKRGSTLQPSPRVLLKRPQPLIRGEIEAWAMEESMKQKHAVDMRVGNYCPGGGLWSGREQLRQAIQTYRSISHKTSPYTATSPTSSVSCKRMVAPSDVASKFPRQGTKGVEAGRRKEKPIIQQPRDSTIAAYMLGILYTQACSIVTDYHIVERGHGTALV